MDEHELDGQGIPRKPFRRNPELRYPDEPSLLADWKVIFAEHPRMEAADWQLVRYDRFWSVINAVCFNFGRKPLDLLPVNEEMKQDLKSRITGFCWFFARISEEVYRGDQFPGIQIEEYGVEDTVITAVKYVVRPVDFIAWRQNTEKDFGPILPELKNLLTGYEGTAPIQNVENPAEATALRAFEKGRKRPDLRDKWGSQRNEILGAAFATLAAYPEDCRDEDGRVNLTKLINQMNSKAGLFRDVGAKRDDGWDLPQNRDTIEKLLREWLAKVP